MYVYIRNSLYFQFRLHFRDRKNWNPVVFCITKWDLVWPCWIIDISINNSFKKALFEVSYIKDKEVSDFWYKKLVKYKIKIFCFHILNMCLNIETERQHTYIEENNNFVESWFLYKRFNVLFSIGNIHCLNYFMYIKFFSINERKSC